MRKRLAGRPSPAMVVAVIALISSLTGGAVAATLITSDDIAKNAVKSKHIANGKVKNKDLKNNTIKTTKVRNGSLLAEDFAEGQLLGGEQGLQGPEGPPGPPGDDGADGADGADGQDLTHTSTLPSGETLTGIYSINNGGDYDGAAIEFRPQLAPGTTITPHYIGTADANCPGPGQAEPGHLCVYEDDAFSVTLNGFADPRAGGSGQVDEWGTIFYLDTSAATSFSNGTWAVTAP